MYDDSGESLFGHDGRHKPNPIPELLTERGWGSSHGRLAYSNMNRQQDSNMSEYAINTIGMLPKNYVIINESTMDYNPDTAFRVGPHRVAIPVKELARERWLTIQEQWELMNPRFIGTYFNIDFDSCRSKRPDFDEAYQEAIANGDGEQFLSQFWTLEYEHSAAIYRLRLRLDNLEDERMTLKMRMNHKEANVKRIKSDIAFQRVHLYNNIQKSLWKAEEEFEQATHDYYNHLGKIDKLKTYLKRYTIK
jgi:hypothetical protein